MKTTRTRKQNEGKHKLKIFAKPKSMFNIVKKPDSLLD